jgi:uncharacterized SAM-binding protein YcdF (DUF218 family)
MTVQRTLAAVVVLLGLVALSPLPGAWLIRDVPIDRPDAILSLASHERERFPTVAAQAKHWPAAKVLLTVPNEVNRYNCDACSHRTEWLEALGVRGDRIVVLSPGTLNTRGEVQLAAAWLRDHGLARLLVVTSPYHTRRVRLLSRTNARGIEVGVTASTALGGVPTPWWARRYGRWYVTYEYAALLAALVRP